MLRAHRGHSDSLDTDSAHDDGEASLQAERCSDGGREQNLHAARYGYDACLGQDLARGADKMGLQEELAGDSGILDTDSVNIDGQESL